jgi:hypothetical protein
VRRLHRLLEGAPARGAEALEAGQLCLDRDAGRGGRLDQRRALFGDRPCVVPGGIETEADLAAALADERREPVGERCGD